jgi:hypothetical protein
MPMIEVRPPMLVEVSVGGRWYWGTSKRGVGPSVGGVVTSGGASASGCSTWRGWSRTGYDPLGASRGRTGGAVVETLVEAVVVAKAPHGGARWSPGS